MHKYLRKGLHGSGRAITSRHFTYLHFIFFLFCILTFLEWLCSEFELFWGFLTVGEFLNLCFLRGDGDLGTFRISHIERSYLEYFVE